MYAMRTPQGIWLWMLPATADADPAPVVIGGVGGPVALQTWLQHHATARVQWRDHPAVPALGAATLAPVWLSTLPQGAWVAWHGDGVWAVPTAWSTLAAATAALAAAGRPWRLFTPAAVWRAVHAGSGPQQAGRPWHLGQAPTGACFAWQPGTPVASVRAGAAPDAPLYLWPSATAAADFLAAQHQTIRGFCPPAATRRLVRARALPRRPLIL